MMMHKFYDNLEEMDNKMCKFTANKLTELINDWQKEKLNP